jgi:hypothetical protein
MQRFFYIFVQTVCTNHNHSNMKKIIIAPVVALLFLCSIFMVPSCSKSSDAATSSFTWTYRDTTNTAVAHKAFISSMATTPIIVASKTNSFNPARLGVSITLTNFAVGTYNVTSGSVANGLMHVNSQGDIAQATAGTITITAYANNLLSGTFSVTITELISGITRPVTGSFSNTPVEL